MRILAIVAAFLSISCSTGGQYPEQIAVVEKLFLAAQGGDSVTVRGLSEQDVPARLRAMRAQAPQLMNAAAGGLEIANVRSATSDSVYLSLRPTSGSKSEIIDVGLYRGAGGWKVYYLTSPSRM